ncbi:FH2 domain-containing protein 1-like [Daktulosphaira vitifoliae]|uniref:FH2 domain-containing protein 1-like n=1 Tax=Daktulosphaira vitifoliae TaxID=58002 RepID=UPI0021AA141B|nr:FH2 domain-containing protein 1-like [Daktulosphaira vitifoliae]
MLIQKDHFYLLVLSFVVYFCTSNVYIKAFIFVYVFLEASPNPLQNSQVSKSVRRKKLTLKKLEPVSLPEDHENQLSGEKLTLNSCPTTLPSTCTSKISSPPLPSVNTEHHAPAPVPIMSPPSIPSSIPTPPSMISGCTSTSRTSSIKPTVVKTKTINWTKVNNQNIENSLWSTLEPLHLAIECQDIVELFGEKPRSNTSPIQNAKLKSTATNVLDSKRSLAINIMLKQLKSKPEEFFKCLEDGSMIAIEKLEAVKRILPISADLKAIEKFSGDIMTLGKAEQFCVKLNEIPYYQLKIDLTMLKEEWPFIYSESLETLKNYQQTCSTLINDKSLTQFLSVVLHLGNKLNAGSYAGEANGFTLGSLPKLIGTRSNKPNVTFVHLAVEMAEKCTNNTFSFLNLRSSLNKLSKTSFECLEAELRNRSRHIKNFKSTLAQENYSQVIKKHLIEFICQADKDIDVLNDNFKTTVDLITNLASHFGENTKSFNVEECFSILDKFFEQIHIIIKENENKKAHTESNVNNDEKNGIACKSVDTNFNKNTHSRFEDKQLSNRELLMNQIKKGSFSLKSIH